MASASFHSNVTRAAGQALRAPDTLSSRRRSGHSLIRDVANSPALRALQNATGCSLVVDYREPTYCAWLFDADKNQLAVRRDRNLETMISWMADVLLREQSKQTRVRKAFTHH
jgi:hypothetical protein